MDGTYVYLSSDASEAQFPGNNKAAFTVHLAEPIDLDPRFEWFVALTEILFQSDANKAVASTSATAGPIFVYMDALCTSRVGDTTSKLLRIASETKAHQTFPDRYYIPVINGRIDNITTLLTDRSGTNYPLNTGNTPVIAVLHFSRRELYK